MAFFFRQRAGEIVKVWNWPGSMVWPSSAVQVMDEAASVIDPSPAGAGVASSVSVISAVQPGTGWVRTEAKGASSGRVIWICSVAAVSDSLGTENVIWVYPPAAVVVASAETWAEAGARPRAMHEGPWPRQCRRAWSSTR